MIFMYDHVYDVAFVVTQYNIWLFPPSMISLPSHSTTFWDNLKANIQDQLLAFIEWKATKYKLFSKLDVLEFSVKLQ